MTTSQPLLIEESAGVLWLTLNRHDALNALNRPLAEELLKSIEVARSSDSCRVIVLSGSGRAFCAGDDISGVQAYLDGNRSDDSVATDRNDGFALYLRIAQAMRLCPKPIIAAVNGVAYGAGAELLCAADLRCMTSSASIGSGLVNIGAMGNVAMMTSIIGEARAFEIYLTGRAVDSSEALRIGLVHYVYKDGAFATEVANLAESIGRKPTKVISFQKKLMNECRGKSFAERIVLQDEYHRLCFAECDDSREGAKAFLEKRPANFSGH